jgi:hypothetical protein
MIKIHKEITKGADPDKLIKKIVEQRQRFQMKSFAERCHKKQVSIELIVKCWHITPESIIPGVLAFTDIKLHFRGVVN